METVALLYEDYQKELAEDFKNTFLKRASDTDSSRSNDTVIDEVTDMLSTNIAVYTEKLLQRWGFSSGGEGGGGGDVTVTLDDLLKKYLSDNYVTIKGDQEVFGEKDFRKGIRIAGRRLYWDEGNDALVIEGAAYTTRWLSAKGVSPGGGGAGSGGAAAMYQLIDVSPNDTKDAVLGAEKDYVLTFDGSFWRGMPNKGGLSSKLFTALDKEGNEVNPDDENAEIYAIRANYSLWSVGFLSAKGISDGGTGGGGGGAVALYQLLDVEKNADITGVAGATKGSVLTFNGDKWYADKPKTAAGISNLFTALDNDGNEVDLNDESKLGTITNIRANYALWSVDWISAKGKSSGGSGGGGGLINLVYGFESLGGTFDNNDNSATFNAFTINEIWKLASSGLTNVTVTGSGNAVTDVIKGSDGRSLTFTKGSTFATKSEFDALNTKFNDFLTGSDADDIINKWSELEVFLQGMKESDNLAVILQSKMDKTAFSKLFTALDASGNEVDPSDDTKTIASIRANFGFWGVDYISAKGVSKGSGGTGGASTLYQLVDVLANDTEDGVEGAAAGKALVFDGTHWRAGDAGLNESQLYSYLTANKYLTQSAADSRYVTSSRKVIAGNGLSGGGALTSDVTLSLGTSGVVAGTYTKVMVDAYGRVTSGTNLSATDIPNLDWSKITTGKPTTLAGYGITDAVTLTTAQTISGRKTFSQNIVFNNNGGITYTDSNVVLRNSDGHTILASFGNGEINLRPNGHNNTEGAVWINKAGNVQAPSVSTNTITIGDAQLVYDSANKALRVKHRTDGNTVGFYSDGWVSALGVKTGGSGGGSGVVNTVYSFANLTDGTTFSDSDLDNTFNAYTIKKLYDMAGQGGLDADAMWAELKKADSSKIIDASHIPTSVLDGRWVKKAGDTMTGALTSASSSGSIVFKGLENCDITNIYKDNGVIRNDDGGLTSIRNGLRFNWYDTYWYIGNLRGSSTDSAGFGVVDHNNKLVLRVTPNDVRAPRFMSTVATGVSPLIVSSNTTVDNLSADLLDGYHAFGTSNALIKYGNTVGGTEPAWCRIATYSIRNTETMTDVCFVLHSAFDDLFGLLVVRTRGMSYVQGELMVAYNINTSNIRIYHDAEKKNIELYCYGGSKYSIIQANLLYSHDRNGGHNTAITLYRSDTKAPSWSTYVNPVFANLQNSSEAAKKLQTPRTLWGQSFDGTANVSGDMTGVGNITMSGDLKIGNGTSPNTIYFYGTTGDSPGGYNYTFIAERLWGGTESSELVLFKGNDLGTGNEAVNVNGSGPDRIRHIAAAHLFQTYTSPLAGSVEDVCTSSALKSLFGIAENRVTSYVPFMSTVGTGKQPYQCNSTTLNTNLNADMLDNWHLNFLPRNYNIGRCYAVKFALGGEDNGWKKIFACSESGATPYRSVTVWGRIWYAHGNHAQSEVRNYHFCAIFYMRSGPSSSDSSVGNVENSARLYLPTFAKGMDNIRLVRVGTNNFELQVRQIGSYHNANIEYQYWSYGCNVSAWESLQPTSNTSVVVSAGDASTLADSRASSADVWTTARTFYIQDHDSSHTGAGVNVNGGSNVYLKLPNSIQCGDWFRSTGNSGWYHQDYGGGIYMQDSNFIRNFGSKRLRIQTDTYDTLQLVRTSGSGGSSIAFYNGGGTFRGQLGVNASSWFSFDTGTATANQNVVEISPAGGIHSKAEITAKASGSDIRLKKDIQNYNAMNIINKFRSVKYHWNDIAKANSEVYNNDYDQFGLIAQDLIAGGFKQWVRDVFHDYYTVTYERLIPVVWKGLQEVDDEVTKLKREVARLNKRVKELEKSLCA